MQGWAARRTERARGPIWIALAALIGLAAARLPVTASGGGLALAVLAAAALIEPVLALVLMLAVAPLKTLIETEAGLALPADVGQIALALVVGAWAVTRAALRRADPLPRTRLYLALLLIMAGFAPSLWAASVPGAWLSEFLKWIEMLLLVLIVLDLGRERQRWAWISFGIVLAAALQAALGLYEFLGGSGAPHLWIADYRYFRAFGTFGQPNPFSAFMGLTLPLALGMAWGYIRRAGQQWRAEGGRLALALPVLFYGGASGLLLGGLLASWGRGAWLGFGAAGVVMVFFSPRRRWQGFLLLAVSGTLGAMLALAGLLPASIEQRIVNTASEFGGFQDVRGVPVNDENFAVIERLAHWQAAINMANAHPVIGVGLGNYEAAYPAYRVPSWPRALGHAHNDYLNLLAETGVIGLAGYLAGWSLIVFWTLRALHQTDPVLNGLALGLLGAWTHLAVHSLFDKLYVNNLFLHIGVMLGLLAIACRQRRSGHRV
ncbi:MAG: O-antigen ligase family protein [Chloroflexi bacterium]|nr:O-antigen ligase family protein [Chloroflexota bacterium]